MDRENLNFRTKMGQGNKKLIHTRENTTSIFQVCYLEIFTSQITEVHNKQGTHFTPSKFKVKR